MNPEDDAPPAYTRYPEQEPPRGSAVISDGRPDVTSSPPPALPPRAKQRRSQTPFASVPASATPQKFPVSWSLHRGPTAGVYDVRAGDDNGSPPAFTVSQTPGSTAGQPNLILHDGASVDLPPLATGERHKTFTGGIHSVITLPGSGSGISPEEPLRTIVSWPHISYAFDIDVGTADPRDLGRLRRETFEWRHSAGSAVALLGAATSGWKLIRTTTDPPPGVSAEEWAITGGGEFSSDGKEIVAVWADSRRNPGTGIALKFRFLGTGANGVLGERWEIMAAMSALRIWQQGEMARR